MKQLTVPTILSALCLVLTHHFFGEHRSAGLGERTTPPVAVLEQGASHVERRPSDRLVWQKVDTGTALHRGDAVRTYRGSDTDIRILQGSTIVRLEPDSLIVLSEASDKLELDLISGSLTLEKAAGGAGDAQQAAPVIKAGKTKIVLKEGDGAQLSLSRKKGEEAAIAVSKGSVVVQGAGREFRVAEGQMGELAATGLAKAAGLTPLSPAPNAQLVFRGNEARLARFTWRATGEGVATVRLEMGESAGALQDAGVAAPVAAGALAHGVELGAFYWRLVAYDKGGARLAATVPLRATVDVELTPEPTAPLAGTTIRPGADGRAEVVFRWRAGVPARALRLEVATDPGFTRVAHRSEVGLASEHRLAVKRGSFHWRLVAADGSRAPASTTAAFAVSAAEPPPSPSLRSPAEGAAITVDAQGAPGVELSWDAAARAVRYRVELKPEGGEARVTTVETPRLRMARAGKGVYSWRVRSVDAEDIESAWSPQRRYRVSTQAQLSWMVDRDGEKMRYDSARPVARLRWAEGPRTATRWRVRAARGDDLLANVAWTQTAKPQINLGLPADGRYSFEAQALDAAGAVVAATPPLTLDVQPTPPLAPPRLATAQRKADGSGRYVLDWERVQGAASYDVEARHENGQDTRQLSAKRGPLELRQLLPGRYVIRARTIDGREVAGPYGPEMVVEVPRVSDVPPPEVGGVKVH